MIQGSMFPALVPEAVAEAAVSAAERFPEVPRPSGAWTLLAGRRGPCGWHWVVSRGEFGLVVAACGARGWALYEDEPVVVLCRGCADVAPMSPGQGPFDPSGEDG